MNYDNGYKLCWEEPKGIGRNSTANYHPETMAGGILTVTFFSCEGCNVAASSTQNRGEGLDDVPRRNILKGWKDAMEKRGNMTKRKGYKTKRRSQIILVRRDSMKGKEEDTDGKRREEYGGNDFDLSNVDKRLTWHT